MATRGTRTVWRGTPPSLQPTQGSTLSTLTLNPPHIARLTVPTRRALEGPTYGGETALRAEGRTHLRIPRAIPTVVHPGTPTQAIPTVVHTGIPTRVHTTVVHTGYLPGYVHHCYTPGIPTRACTPLLYTRGYPPGHIHHPFHWLAVPPVPGRLFLLFLLKVDKSHCS